ncbi:hypothetical protein SeLEV6574_g06144 [Synchytrium endobioticum]|nr:hypothetical protein SeLEV6574_g06144 [Synchytrium endobioticum]
MLRDVDKAYVLNYRPMECSEWKWLLPQSNARYANHSCDPNGIITNDQHAKTIKLVKKGEQITFVYNVGSDEDWWDPLWSFKCECGAGACQGIIDYRYRTVKNQFGRKVLLDE